MSAQTSTEGLVVHADAAPIPIVLYTPFQLYVDGAIASAVVSGGAVPFTAPLTGSGPAMIGYDAAWNTYLPGSVDEIAVYLRVLPAARVAAHYQSAGY